MKKYDPVKQFQLLIFLFSRIFYYSTAYTSDAVFIIGGHDGSPNLSIVAQFKDNEWTQVADLNQGRNGHGSITIGDQTLIIGGPLVLTII